MSGRRIILIGGGEHARAIAEAVRSNVDRFELVGFVDSNECSEITQALGIRRLGDDLALSAYPEALAILGFGTIGRPRPRAETVDRLSSSLGGWATVVHAHAWVSPTATVGEGTIVMAGAVVQTGARIGSHCIINSGAVIEHDVVLSDHVQIAPGAVLGGGVSAGWGAFVGLGASVRDHVSLGDESIVGMGAVVIGDVSRGATVLGVPAR
jgi:acetyltransferase EpsM